MRGFRPERLLPLACIGGAILLTASQFLNIFELNEAGGVTVKLISSADQHWYAMAVLGVFAGVATIGAITSGSKPLAAAVVAAGGVALLLFLLIDLPDANKAGALSDPTSSFPIAEADPAGGFWLELIGALILTVCGGALATLTAEQLRSLRPGRPRRHQGRRSRDRRQGGVPPESRSRTPATDSNPTETATTEPGASRQVRRPSRSVD